MADDLSHLSDESLKYLYSITQQESGGDSDTSTITSLKGATGSMQVMPGTASSPGFGIQPSNGTPEDTARVGREYYLALQDKYQDPMIAAMAYNWGPGNTDNWLKNGADLSKVPDETLKYAHNFSKNNPTSQAPQPSPTVGTSPKNDLSKLSDDDLKKLYAQQQPLTANQRAQNILQPSREQANQAVNQVQGLGEVGVSGLTGMFGQAAGLLHGGAELAQGKGLEAAKQAFNQEVAPVTYQPRTPEGQAINERLGQGYEQYIQNPAEKISQTSAGLLFPNNPQAQEYAKTFADVLTGAAAATIGGGEATRGAPKVPETGVPGDIFGKVAPQDDAAAPGAQKPSEFVGPYPEGGGPLQGQPNAGPPRPAIQVDAAGNAKDPTQPVTAEQLGAEMGRARQQSAEQQAVGDLFPDTLKTTEGMATPYEPNREALVSPIEPETMQGQGRLELDPMQDKMQAMRDMTPEQLDMFNPIDQRTFDQFGEEEAPRTLTPEEFEQTVRNLADKDGTRFPLPDDMDVAYGKYLDTTRDDQGGLFDRATIAKNFAEKAVDEALERKVNDHPIVRANQARLDNLEAQMAAMPQNRPTALRPLQGRIDAARTLLERSQNNIKRELEPAAKAVAPYERDGVVYMHTFGHLPTLMKSLGAILKALHGVVFKTLDRLLPNMKNLDSRGKIYAQGIKNFVNREATREWPQTVNEQAIKQIGKIPGTKEALTELNPHAQEDLSPEQLKAQFNQATDLSESKVGNALRNNLLQGGLMLSDFSRHPLVKFTTDSVAKAFRTADKWTRENLLNKATGLGPMIKRMDLKDFTAIRTLMEANEGVKEFTENELRNMGHPKDAIDYYKRSLELQKDAFNKFNAGRVAAGLKPVDARIAHIAGYFTGDFKQIVKDSAGRIVAVLGHNDRGALATIAKRFQELHPDGANLDMGKPFLRKGSMEDNSFHGFMNVLNELSKSNADIDRLVQAYKDVQMASTNKLSQMANRGKFKTSPENRVGGAEGQKLWQSMQKNAIDGGKQQLKYLEAVNKWSEFQKAIQKSQDFISDPEVNAPNAKAVSQKYLDNQMHRNLGELNKFTNSFVNGIAEITGVGPTTMRQWANFTKTGLLNMFVGLGKFSHSLVTLIQPLIGIPLVNSMLKARGASFGVSQFTAVMKSMLSNKDILQSLATGKGIKDDFVRAANQYAKDNDTFNTSQFNMGSVTHPSTKLGNALHINVTVPESGSRAFTYMYYVHMLKDSVGDTMSDKEIFGSAHNAVQKVMGDYSREAAAPIFNKMGFLGDLTRMLTTFKMNQISQAATASKMFRQGQVMPMVTMLATSLASAGLRGFIGYNLVNGALGQLTTWATKQGMMKQPTNLDQILLHMLHGMNPHLADALNFGATSALGIDMTGSLSHADDIPDDPLGTLIPEGNPLTKMMGSTMTAIEHPNKHNAEAAVYDTLPNSLKGIMENTVYTDEKGRYYDPHSGNLVSQRTPTEQAQRAFSFRPLAESKMRLETNVSKGQEQQLGEVKSEIIKRVLSDADSNNGKVPDIQKYAQDYQQAGGDPRELVDRLVTHLGVNKNLDILQRQAGIPEGYTAAEKYQRVQGLK